MSYYSQYPRPKYLKDVGGHLHPFDLMYNFLYDGGWPCSIDDEEVDNGEMEALWERILKYEPSEVVAEIPGFEDMTGTTSFLHWVVRCSDDYGLAEYICSLSFAMDWKDDDWKDDEHLHQRYGIGCKEGKYYAWNWKDDEEGKEIISLADLREKCEPNYRQQNAAAIIAHGDQIPLHKAIIRAGHTHSNIEIIKLLIREYPAGLAVKNNMYSRRETPLQVAETSKYSVPPPEVIQLLRDCTEAYESNNIRRVYQLCGGVSLYRLHLRSTFLCCLNHLNAPRTQRRNKRAKTGEIVSKGLVRAWEVLPTEIWSVVLSYI